MTTRADIIKKDPWFVFPGLRDFYFRKYIKPRSDQLDELISGDMPNALLTIIPGLWKKFRLNQSVLPVYTKAQLTLMLEELKSDKFELENERVLKNYIERNPELLFSSADVLAFAQNRVNKNGWRLRRFVNDEKNIYTPGFQEKHKFLSQHFWDKINPHNTFWARIFGGFSWMQRRIQAKVQRLIKLSPYYLMIIRKCSLADILATDHAYYMRYESPGSHWCELRNTRLGIEKAQQEHRDREAEYIRSLEEEKKRLQKEADLKARQAQELARKQAEEKRQCEEKARLEAEEKRLKLEKEAQELKAREAAEAARIAAEKAALELQKSLAGSITRLTVEIHKQLSQLSALLSRYPHWLYSTDAEIQSYKASLLSISTSANESFSSMSNTELKLKETTLANTLKGVRALVENLMQKYGQTLKTIKDHRQSLNDKKRLLDEDKNFLASFKTDTKVDVSPDDVHGFVARMNDINIEGEHKNTTDLILRIDAFLSVSSDLDYHLAMQNVGPFLAEIAKQITINSVIKSRFEKALAEQEEKKKQYVAIIPTNANEARQLLSRLNKVLEKPYNMLEISKETHSELVQVCSIGATIPNDSSQQLNRLPYSKIENMKITLDKLIEDLKKIDVSTLDSAYEKNEKLLTAQKNELASLEERLKKDHRSLSTVINKKTTKFDPDELSKKCDDLLKQCTALNSGDIGQLFGRLNEFTVLIGKIKQQLEENKQYQSDHEGFMRRYQENEDYFNNTCYPTFESIVGLIHLDRSNAQGRASAIDSVETLKSRCVKFRYSTLPPQLVTYDIKKSLIRDIRNFLDEEIKATLPQLSEHYNYVTEIARLIYQDISGYGKHNYLISYLFERHTERQIFFKLNQYASEARTLFNRSMNILDGGYFGPQNQGGSPLEPLYNYVDDRDPVAEKRKADAAASAAEDERRSQKERENRLRALLLKDFKKRVLVEAQASRNMHNKVPEDKLEGMIEEIFKSSAVKTTDIWQIIDRVVTKANAEYVPVYQPQFAFN